MSKVTISPQQIADIKRLIDNSRKVSIVCHMAPDGDAMGSSLCLYHILTAMGHSARVVVPDMPPELLRFLPGASRIVIATQNPVRAADTLKGANLIVCLDFNDLKRIDRMAPMIEASSARRIVIDHHLNPTIEADVVVSHPEVSSTCALLFQVVEALGLLEYMNVESATCCCTGMMTDTGNFSYNSNDAELYRILSVLLEKGVDKDAIYSKVFNTNSESRVRIMGYGQYARMEIFPEHRCALITLSRSELTQLDYHKGDTEALVNVPLSIPGVVYSIFLREDEENYVKVSMRSKGDFSVKELCEEYFDGGGHKNAAGGEMHAPLSEVIEKVLSLMPMCDEKLPVDDDN